MERCVRDDLKLSKQQLLALSEGGLVTQTGAVMLHDSFELPQIDPAIYGPLPSIETFVLSTGAPSPDHSALATGSNHTLNAAWAPAVDRLASTVLNWTTQNGVELVGDSYITVSITAANVVNGEAHFDDGHFDPNAGVGLVATVGDRGGTSVTTHQIPHGEIRPHQSLTADADMKAEFANGGFGRVDHGPHQVVALPQFGQLHSGPGPCGTDQDVRYLMVFRAATAPQSS